MDAKDIAVLSDEKIPEAIRIALAQKILSAKDDEAVRTLEKEKFDLEKRKFRWNTPLVVMTTGLVTLSATFVFDRITAQDQTTNTISLEQHRADLEQQKFTLQQELETLSSEREFQYEIVRAELGKEGKTNAQRAAILLFLARAGVLSALNPDELSRMAKEQQENPNQEIIPKLSASNDPLVLTDLLSQYEGFRAKQYLDPTGIPTIGIGHRITPEEQQSGLIIVDGESIPFKDGITEEQAIRILANELEPIRQRVIDAVKVTIAASQRDALVSFVYNVGLENFMRSKLLQRINAGDFENVPEEFRRWTRGTINGKKVTLPGLVNRREAEIALWLAE